jgi:hypothetical protein
MTKEEYDFFLESYLSKYNLPINRDVLINNLRHTRIITIDEFLGYSFSYSYIYYFFVGKYLADHVSENSAIIDSIINNLQKDENSYIAVFVSHHSKDSYVLDEIILNALTLFDSHAPATLDKEELSFFAEAQEQIVKAALPAAHESPEQERARRLETEDAMAQLGENDEESTEEGEQFEELATELRRSIKTVEVMGRIIKSRAGSLEKSRIEFIFREAMMVHLRILTSFIELIKHEDSQQEIIKYISKRLKKLVENAERDDSKKGPSKDKLERIARTIFWNVNFFVVYGVIKKLVHSLGSDKLTPVIQKVCDEEDTPASFLLKHGMLMWYNKNLQVENIAVGRDKGKFSRTAQAIMDLLVADHCSMHKVTYKDKQRIKTKLGINPKKT